MRNTKSSHKNNIKNKNILFAISSLGLGHSTRSLPIIYNLAQNNNIIIASYGKAYELLKLETKNLRLNRVKLIKLKDYPRLERADSFFSYTKNIFKDIGKVIKLIKFEKSFTNKLVQEYNIDLIISDGRYGFNSYKPSVLITHQISFYNQFFSINPLNPINFLFIKKNFDFVIIPDFEGNHLSGKLSHNLYTSFLNHEFIGILSSFGLYKELYYKNIHQKKYDFLIIIGGYLYEHNNSFINSLINQAKHLKGKFLFILGEINKNYKKVVKSNNAYIELLAHSSGVEKLRFMLSSDKVIGRAGYSTIMDLVELDKEAILIPTPYQSEQTYLAKHLKKKKIFYTEPQRNFNLRRAIHLSKSYSIKNLKYKHKTKESLNKVIEILNYLIE